MATQAYVYDDSFIADGAIGQYRVVIRGGAKDRVALGTANANGIIGVTQHATTASGDTVLVRRAGVTKLRVSSGNVTYGADLEISDASGFADRRAGAFVSGDGVIGQAEEASGASGDIIECWLNIRTVH